MEIEWGYQKANRIESTQDLPPFPFVGQDLQPIPATVITSIIGVDGELKTQSVMANFSYRYPKWKVSPYAGFGLGAFLHDETVTERNNCPTFSICAAILPPGLFKVAYDDSQFAYQIRAGVSARVSQRVEFRVGYRFRSSRRSEIDADVIEGGIRFRF